MMFVIRLITWILIIVFWPISLVKQNIPIDLIPVLSSLVVFLVSFLLFIFKSRYYYYIFLLLPIININLLLFPLIFGIFSILKAKLRQIDYIYLLLSLLLLIVFFNKFSNISIFFYEELDIYYLNLKRGLMGNNVLARLVYNKASLILNKIFTNFFSLLDFNNYFFAFHPRESILVNQNIIKYSFLTMPYFIIGLLNINKLKHNHWLIIGLMSLILSLSLLRIFDINDFIIWPFISLICIYGFKISLKKVSFLSLMFSLIFLVISSWQLLRLIRL